MAPIQSDFSRLNHVSALLDVRGHKHIDLEEVPQAFRVGHYTGLFDLLDLHYTLVIWEAAIEVVLDLVELLMRELLLL